jgi:hypothetical protein
VQRHFQALLGGPRSVPSTFAALVAMPIEADRDKPRTGLPEACQPSEPFCCYLRAIISLLSADPRRRTAARISRFQRRVLQYAFRWCALTRVILGCSSEDPRPIGFKLSCMPPAMFEEATAGANHLKRLEIKFRARGVPLSWVAKELGGSWERGKPNLEDVRLVVRVVKLWS